MPVASRPCAERALTLAIRAALLNVALIAGSTSAWAATAEPSGKPENPPAGADPLHPVWFQYQIPERLSCHLTLLQEGQRIYGLAIDAKLKMQSYRVRIGIAHFCNGLAFTY